MNLLIGDASASPIQTEDKVCEQTGGRGKVVAFSERRGVCNGDAVACKLYAVTFGDG